MYHLGCRRRRSWGAPSRVCPGVLPIHVLAGVGPWVVEGSSTVNPTGWTTVGILSIHLIPLTYLSPEGGGDGAGNTEGNIDVDVNKEGDVCLTRGARARSVVAREAVRTGTDGRQSKSENGGVGGSSRVGRARGADVTGRAVACGVNQ